MSWLLLSGLALAADGSVHGIAFASDGAPLAGVEVCASDVCTISGYSGTFVLTVPAGTHDVVVNDHPLEPIRVAANGRSELLLTVSPYAVSALVEQPTVATDAVDQAAVTAVLAGTVLDPDGAPVAGARVLVRGLAQDARTDEHGRFQLQVPSADSDVTVIRQGFRTLSLRELPPGEHRLELQPSGLVMDDFFVRAPRITGGTASLLDERRDSSSVDDVIGAEAMSRAGDSDAASALSRATGLTVVGGRYVYVRGLGDRYASAQLNGSSLPSPEPERRVVPLDLFPAALLDSLVIQKTWTPDLPGEFGGGMVRIRTRDFPSEPVLSIGVTGGIASGTTFQRGPAGQAGPTDWLGIDGGFRALPEEVRSASSDSPLEESDLFSQRGYSANELEKLGEAMPNRWNVGERLAPPNSGLNLAYGNRWDVGGGYTGLLAAVTWGQQYDRDQFERTYTVLGTGNVLEPSHTYSFDQMTRRVGLGGLVTWGWVVPDRHEVRWTQLLNRSTDDEARIYQGLNRDVGAEIRSARLRYVERSLLTEQLAGEHALPGDGELSWRYAYSLASRSEPDRREIRADNEPGTDLWLISDRPEGNQRFFSDLTDQSHDVGMDLKLPFGGGEAPPFVQLGASVTHKDRAVDTRRFKFMHKGANSRDEDVLAGDPESAFTAENIGSDGFQFEEITRQTDNYGAFSRLHAAYGMADMPLSSSTRLLAGARLEHSRMNVSTFELFNPDQVPVEAELDKLDLLPALALTQSLSEKMQLRAGYARTVSRPEFREMSPATFNDVTGGRQTFGNPELSRATIDHLDLRWELYPRPGESISIAGFAKRFTQPVESIVVVSAQHSVTYDNADAATNLGLELEGRKRLDALGPALDALYVAGNVALIQSRVDLGDNAGIQTSDVRALQGQSPFVVNTQVGWDDPEGPLGFTVLYNVFGTRITEVGALGAPDTYDLPAHRLDATARLALGKGFSLGLMGRNLLDLPVRSAQGALVTESRRQGWSTGLSLNWRPEAPES